LTYNLTKKDDDLFVFYRIEVLKKSGVYRTQVIKMTISARNRMAGVVKAIEKGKVASTVKIEIAKPSVITAMITKEAAEELGLKEGDKVEAVIKATEVMVSKE
jgi:molybdopterin-binding protein